MLGLYTALAELLLTLRDIRPRRIDQKTDGSFVTEVDVDFEAAILEIVLSAGIASSALIVGEESVETHRDQYAWSDAIIVVDPIDGTENFISGSPLYGTAVSVVTREAELHILCAPSLEILVSNVELSWLPVAVTSSVDLFSTKCLDRPIAEPDSARVLGSSVVMFAEFLCGRARSYTYCRGAKIWDCYTGLSLARLAGCNIDIRDNDISRWVLAPTHLTPFRLTW